MAETTINTPKPAVKVSMPKQTSVGVNTGAPVEDKDVLTKSTFISCIAIGQGGYNAMRSMLDKPFVKAENCFYINYETDLRAAELLAPANRININPNSYGAGKSRDKAKSDATQAMSLWQEELRSKISPKTEKMFIFVSAGGGCGSGAGPLIAAVASQNGFLDRKGRRLPVEVILFKPALSPNREEWYNYSECLKEMNALVNAKAISLYIADLSSSEIEDINERNLAVDNEVAELLYRFECLNYISKQSNLDFEDRYVLGTTPQMRGLLRYNPVDGNWSSPFVMPKGNRVARLGCEIPEGDEDRIDSFIKSFGATVLDKSFKGLYPPSATDKGAYPIVGFFGYNIPEALISESSDVVTELNRKAEQLEKNDKAKTVGIFDMLAGNKSAIEESTGHKDQDINDIMNLIQ